MLKEIRHTIRLDEAHETMLRDICGFEGMNVTGILTMLIEHWVDEIERLNSVDEVAYLIGAIDLMTTGETDVTLRED